MTRRAFVNLNDRWVFYWSPKAGNTSLCKWLLDTVENRHGIRDRLEESHGPRGILKLAYGCNDFRLTARLIRDFGFRSFVLARDPYRRVVSAFVEKFVFRNRPITSSEHLHGFAMQFYRYTKGTETSYGGLSFILFLRTLNEIIASTSAGQEPKLNVHWNTQVPFHFKDIGFHYDKILRLESVDADAASVATDLGVQATFPFERSQRPANSPDNEDLSNVSSAELARAQTIPGPANLLTEEASSLIQSVYSIDFHLLRYEASSWAVS